MVIKGIVFGKGCVTGDSERFRLHFVNVNFP